MHAIRHMYGIDHVRSIARALDEPPFAALELSFSGSYFSFFTLGGLATLPTDEVLDRGGKPIAGLFAAGRATSGLPRSGHGYSSGMSLADCTFFGLQVDRISGSFKAHGRTGGGIASGQRADRAQDQPDEIGLTPRAGLGKQALRIMAPGLDGEPEIARGLLNASALAQRQRQLGFLG